ncbi:MAG TPA: GYD domain-containing protein, partial [Acidimicrobiales bacterium]|nr:GYD domain-containing protein [Acidimicrobiales bacterium]
MPKYLIQGTYLGGGVQGLRKEGGSARRAAIERALASVGGQVEAFYFAFGEPDVLAIIDLP